MIEKYEECPKCGASGKDWIYDFQLCSLCEHWTEENEMDTDQSLIDQLRDAAKQHKNTTLGDLLDKAAEALEEAEDNAD